MAVIRIKMWNEQIMHTHRSKTERRIEDSGRTNASKRKKNEMYREKIHS